MSRDEVIISMNHVSKKFCRHLRRSMAYGLLDLSRNFIGVKNKRDHLRQGEFWALDDLCLELCRGESLGVLGINGSGKTTLLRLLTGIFPPDKGEIIVKGRVGALIAIGAGFHPHLTGLENIYLNGSILGLSREEIDERFEQIVEFAEIGDFLDAPISTYSSGMRARLGFAITTAIKPDILFLDEVFAVGDIVFRQRCIEHIRHVSKNTATILVSNRPEFVEMLCTRAIWLEKGKIVAEGEVEEVTTLYTEEMSRRATCFAMTTGASRDGNGDIRFTDNIQIYGSKSGNNKIKIHGEQLVIEVPFACKKPRADVCFYIEIHNLMTGIPLTIVDYEVPQVSADGSLKCIFHKLPLAPVAYGITFKIKQCETVIDSWRFAAKLIAERVHPVPSKKIIKYPHEIIVNIGEERFEHCYGLQKPNEAEMQSV